MHILNTNIKPYLSLTYFHYVISMYANTTALNQGEELNEGIIGFSAYSLMSSSIRWNLISVYSARLWSCYRNHLTPADLN